MVSSSGGIFMKIILNTLILSIVCLIFFSPSAYALRREVGVTFNNDDINLQSEIVLSWEYATGDQMYRTWDGKTWTEIDFAPPTAGQQVTVTSDVYVPYYGLIYFEVRKDAYTSDDRLVSDSPNFVTIPLYPPLKDAHSEFSTRTELCATCHVTHAAEGPKLVNAASDTELCKTCHGPGATGSRYSVWDGTQRMKDGTFQASAGGPVLAGVSNDIWNNKTVTSSHIDATQGPFPGSSFSQTIDLQFNCTDCHSPHASFNGYRLLLGYNDQPVWSWAYNPTGLLKEQIYYEDFSNSPCFTCHILFEASSASGHTVYSTDDPYRGSVNMYRHTAEATDVTAWNGGAANPTITMPLEKEKQIFCLTCHYPHGTTVGGSVYSSYDKNLDEVYTDSTTALKRMDNSAMCQNCHKK